jgi:hypothetical protein
MVALALGRAPHACRHEPTLGPDKAHVSYARRPGGRSRAALVAAAGGGVRPRRANNCFSSADVSFFPASGSPAGGFLGWAGPCGGTVRGLSCPSPVARAREENAGAAGSSERINRPWLVLRRGPGEARPRRRRAVTQRRSKLRSASFAHRRSKPSVISITARSAECAYGAN